MRLLVFLILILTLTFAASSADAHPLPKNSGVTVGLHKICTAVGVCRDPAPRPGPTTPCTESNVGAVEKIWDDRLGAYVEWECREDGKWYRLRIVQRAGLPWDPPQRMWVEDKMRACVSIVCKPRWVAHRYPTRWIFGR